MAYRVEVKAVRGNTQIFVYEKDELVGSRMIVGLDPQPSEVRRLVLEVTTAQEQGKTAKNTLEQIEKDINDELSRSATRI